MRKIHDYLPFLISLFLCLPTNCACDMGDYNRLRDRMVREQIVARGIKDPGVIRAMIKVPRHLFVPSSARAFSYGDYPLPIGDGQTISQPYIVAFMTEALALTADDRVLEIGTGSGYQAAILAELVKEVYTIEIIPELGRRALKTLEALRYKNIRVKIGDGYKGWPEEAPFDVIIVTCAPDKIPKPLIEQLKEGGRMLIPLGTAGGVQKLVKIIKKKGEIETQPLIDVRFVPMVKDEFQSILSTPEQQYPDESVEGYERRLSVAIKVTPDKIVYIAKQLNLYNKNASTDDLLNTILDKIEELTTQSAWRYEKKNQEFIGFYKDCMEEMEHLREYEDTFI